MKNGVITFSMLLVIALLASPLVTSAEEIKIGVLYPLSGPMAAVGEECFRGVEIARIVQNERGGILGKQIKYIVADAPDATAAVAEAERLITKEGMKVIMGTMSSSLSYAASAVAEKNEIIYWETHAVADNITQRGFRYLFRMVPRASDYGRMHVEFAKEIGAKNIAILYEDTLFGTSVAAGARDYAKKIGLPIILDESYSLRAVDLSSLVLKVKAANPDHVIAVSYIADAILLTRQMKELGCYVPVLIGTGAGHNVPDFITALKTDGNYFGAMVGWNWDFKTPETENFVKLYIRKHGHRPYGHDAGQGYNAAMVLFNILERAGSLDPQVVRKAFLETDIKVTMSGYGVKFDPRTGDNIRGRLAATQWQKFELYTVWPKEIATREFIWPMPKWEERK